MRDLPFVDQQAEVGLALEHGLRDLVEGHLDDGRIADVHAQEQRRRGVAARDRDDLVGDVLPVHGLAADQDGAIAFAHRRAWIHHAIPVVDHRVGRRRDCRHLELRGARAAIEGFDVLEHVLDFDVARLHLPRGEGVEHEGVVGVRAMADADPRHGVSS
jgi:hypothetical protein